MAGTGPGSGSTGGAGAAPRDAEAGADAAAVAACRAGDREAFAAIVARHQARVYGFALRWTGRPSDAADLAQEAFLRAFAALPRFDARRPLVPWLMRIAVNLCRDWQRRNRDRARVDDPGVWESLADQRLGPAEQLEAAERGRAVRQAVAQLPEAYRLLVSLVYDEDLPLRDVAAATGLPLSVVKNRLFRARRRLAAVLGGLVREGVGDTPAREPDGGTATRGSPG